MYSPAGEHRRSGLLRSAGPLKLQLGFLPPPHPRALPRLHFLSCVGFLSLFVCRASFPQDQYDIIEKHTQSGLELVEKYVKFVKERTEIEQNYAKQLR